MAELQAKRLQWINLGRDLVKTIRQVSASEELEGEPFFLNPPDDDVEFIDHGERSLEPFLGPLPDDNLSLREYTALITRRFDVAQRYFEAVRYLNEFPENQEITTFLSQFEGRMIGAMSLVELNQLAPPVERTPETIWMKAGKKFISEIKMVGRSLNEDIFHIVDIYTVSPLMKSDEFIRLFGVKLIPILGPVSEGHKITLDIYELLLTGRVNLAIAYSKALTGIPTREQWIISTNETIRDLFDTGYLKEGIKLGKEVDQVNRELKEIRDFVGKIEHIENIGTLSLSDLQAYSIPMTLNSRNHV